MALDISKVSSNDVTCHGGNDGNIKLIGTGGVPSYRYLWSNGISGTQVSNVAAMDYSVIVVDNNSCQATRIFSVSEPTAIILTEKTASHVDLSCHGVAIGVIEVQATGGMGQYQYSINNGTMTDSTVFFGLAANTYSFRVKDMASCVNSMFQDVAITELSAMTLGSLSGTDISCNGKNDGAIALPAYGGTAPLTYTLTLNGVATSNISGSTNGNFTNVSAGINYSIVVNDANNCGSLVSSSVAIAEPNAITITKDSVTKAKSSNPWNGSRIVVATGGTWILTYTLGNQSQDNGYFSGLAPGSYTVLVMDQNNCGLIAVVPCQYLTQPQFRF